MSAWGAVPELGHAALLVALALSALGAVAGVWSARSLDPRWLAVARRVAAVQFVLVTGVTSGVEGGLGANSAGATRPKTNPCP